MSFLPPFHHCVRAHHHHPAVCSSREPPPPLPTSRYHEFLLTFRRFSRSPSYRLSPSPSLSYSRSSFLPMNIDQQQHYAPLPARRSDEMLTDGTARKTTRSRSLRSTSIFVRVTAESNNPLFFFLFFTLSLLSKACLSVTHSSFSRLPRNEKNIPPSGETDRPAPYAANFSHGSREIYLSFSLFSRSASCLSCSLCRFGSGGLPCEASKGFGAKSSTQK